MAERYSVLATMIYSRLQNRGRLVCALLATTLLLPALAFADHATTRVRGALACLPRLRKLG